MPIGSIIVGSSTSALMYCLFSDSVLVVSSDHRPAIYSTIEGRSELELWEEVYWILFLQNKILTHNVKNTNIYQDKIEIIHENNIKNIWTFDLLYLDSCEQVSSLGFDILSAADNVEVRDYFAVKRGMAHKKTCIKTPDSFVSKVVFYVSTRIDGNKKKKDAVAISYMKKEHLTDFDYSDTMVRFKLEKLMNLNLNLSRKVKVQHLRREIMPTQKFKIGPGAPKVKKLPATSFKKLYAKYKSEYTE